MKKISLHSIGKRLTLVYVFLLFLLALVGFKYFKTTEKKAYYVLVIHSFEEHYPWGDELIKGIADCFIDQQIKVRFEHAYMDSEALLAEEEEQFIRDLLDANMEEIPDLILVSDDQATYSLLAANHSLAHRIPIVFSGVDYPNKKMLDKYDNVTGFTTQPDFVKCMKLIKYVYPNTKYFSLNITDNYLGKTASEHFLAQTAQMVEFKCAIYNMGIETIEMLGWSLLAPRQRFIVPIWDPFYCELLENYNCPYFLVNSEGLGDGPLGGYLTLPYDQGYQAAQLGIQVLKGAKISDLPIETSPKVAVFDWIQMERFKITSGQLPPDSQIINMPFYIRYKYPALITAFFLFLSIMGLIVMFIRLYLRERKEKRQALLRLQDHKNMLDIAMKSIGEGVISIDKELQIFTINRAALEWLGLDTDASLFIGRNIKTLLNIITPVDKHSLQTMLTRLFTENQDSLFEAETQIQLLDIQKIISVGGELSGIFQDGELIGAVITFHDLTQEIIRKKFLSLSMSTGNMFSWQFDRRMDAFTFDQSFFLHLHMSVPDKRQISFQDIKHMIYPEDMKVLEGTIAEIYTGNSPRITRQLRVNFTGKGYTWWEFRFTVMSGYVDEVSDLIYGLLFNIQSFKEIEEELVHSYMKAEQSEKLKSAFLANMSHEIRTPLNGIVGFSNLLTSGENLEPEETQVFIDTIRKNGNLLLALITDILDLASIESNNMTFKFSSCNVNALIEQVVTTQRVIIPEHLHLICRKTDHLVMLVTDPLRLNQVLTNLINNAVKFTSEGSITIGFTDDEPGFLNFFVKDTGKGIAAKDLDSVFVRFFKKDDFTQGAGLGLSICKMIIDRFNGTISVSSELGVGTCFTVRIPTNLITTK